LTKKQTTETRGNLLLFTFYFVSEFATREFQDYEERMERNVTYQLLVHAAEVNLSNENMN
jgi:hypothetical protein